MSQVTKRALEQSLKNLLLKKPLTKITVADIADDCGINRMTFYYHFKDIYDLVEWSCLEDARRALDENTYSVAIPLGATINMAGAAITISVLTLAAAHTLGIVVDISTAILLCVVAAVCACGASGVAGGSLLLIPMACAPFGLPGDVAMQVVAIGFIIGVIQDSMETALNSSSDVLFTATADFYNRRKQR